MSELIVQFIMMKVVFLLSFFKLSYACIDDLQENVLYKIRNQVHAEGRFYYQVNWRDIDSTTSDTNRPLFFWYVVKHPTKPATFKLFNFNFTEYVWEAYPKATTWNSGHSNSTNDDQWIRMINIEADKTSNKNNTRCILSMQDSESGKCFLYQGVSAIYLLQVDCSNKNETQKAPNSNSIFEFYRISGCSFIIESNGCTAGNERYCQDDPNRCRNQVCEKLERHFGIDCEDPFVRNIIYEKLRKCNDFSTCFGDFKDVYPHTHANCRARPQLCMPHACTYLNRRVGQNSFNCDNFAVRDHITSILKNCYDPNIDRCLESMATNSNVDKNYYKFQLYLR